MADKKKKTLRSSTADAMRNAYGDFSGNTFSDIRTVARGASDLLGGGKGLIARTALDKLSTGYRAKRAAAAKKELDKWLASATPAQKKAYNKSLAAAKATAKADAAASMGEPPTPSPSGKPPSDDIPPPQTPQKNRSAEGRVLHGRDARRRQQTTSMGTGTNSRKGKVTIEEIKDKAKGGMIKKAKGGMAKKTSAKKTSTRSKPKGVGVATRGYGRVMR